MSLTIDPTRNQISKYLTIHINASGAEDSYLGHLANLLNGLKCFYILFLILGHCIVATHVTTVNVSGKPIL